MSVAVGGASWPRIYATRECGIDLAWRELRIRGASVPLGERAFETVEVPTGPVAELAIEEELINRV